MKKLNELLSGNVEVKVDRDWAWVSGDTKPIKEDLKELGFRWSPRRKQWYHRDATSLGINDIVETKAISKVSNKASKPTTKAKAKASKPTTKSKTSKSSKASANARSTYKYGAKRFINDFADRDELSEILDMIISRISE